MALIPCPHCDRHVKEGEARCPFCDGKLGSRGGGGLTAAAVIAGAALIAPGCSGDKKEVAGPDRGDGVEQVDSVPADPVEGPTGPVDAAPPDPVDEPPVDAAEPPPPPPPDDIRNKKPYGAPPSRDRVA